MSLKHKSILGAIWAGVQKFGTMILSFISNLILARLLTPDDFGCIGMLAIFIALSQTFIDGGFGSALIQKDEPTQKDFSTVFFWNVSLAILLYVLMYFTAPLIASFYRITLLEKLLRVQALILIVNSLGMIQRIILRKQLLFKQQALIDVSSSLLGVLIAILLAYKGYGVWSLVFYQLTLSIFQTIGLWLIHKWRPKFEFDFVSFRKLFSYGGFLLISDMLNTVCDNIQGMIIGRGFSPSIMGYYTQAKKLEEVPTVGISYVVAQVTFPVFSSIKNQFDRLQSTHKKSLLASNYVNIPLMLLLIIIAEPLIVFLFTDKWVESVPYFRILCVAGMANCMQSVNYQLYVAIGRSKSMFKWNVLKRSVGIVLIILGALYGVSGVLWGMVAGFWFTYGVNATLAGKITGYTLLKQLGDTLLIVFVSGLAGSVIVPIPYLLNQSNFIVMIIQIFIYLITFLIFSALLKMRAFVMYKSLFGEILDNYRTR